MIDSLHTLVKIIWIVYKRLLTDLEHFCDALWYLIYIITCILH
jgi:hypothetical protein